VTLPVANTAELAGLVSGFNVLETDYRGFGLTPGRPTEAGMYDGAEAAYQALLRRGVAERYPYSHALKLFAAANDPKHLITFDFATDDGFGGHVDALYEHVDILQSALAGLIPDIPPPDTL
jgi:hypothetical protein